MNKIIPTAAALAFALSLPLAAEAQSQGHGKGGAHSQDKGGGRGGDNKQDRGGDRGQGGGEGRGRGQERVDRDVRPNAPDVRQMARGPDSGQGRGQGRGQGQGQGQGRSGNDDRDDRMRVREDRPVAVFHRERDRGLIAGCPPGLAKRDNGCLPPGQERKIARARYNWLWGSDRDADWRYDDGYLYRLDRSGSVTGWLPALGGALAPGAVWPQQYAYQPVTPYYADYFRLSDPYDYRYANGALYGVDPKTQAITQVVALLTGQPITVGQPMPAGYDVYNVPYNWRDRYADTSAAHYRYNDGYVYQIDPTTQLVQAAIQLLT